jgi:hypothetical protein
MPNIQSIDFCKFINKPVKKITLIDFPSIYTYELMYGGCELLKSKLENEYQVFNFSEESNHRNTVIDVLKDAYVHNEINEKMTKEQNKNSLNFVKMNTVTLKVHPNTPYKFMEDVYRFKIEGYCFYNENIIEYSEVLEINQNE